MLYPYYVWHTYYYISNIPGCEWISLVCSNLLFSSTAHCNLTNKSFNTKNHINVLTNKTVTAEKEVSE